MLIYCIKLDHVLYSINGNAKFDSFAHNVFCLSWLSGWKPMYLLVPNKNAECNIAPLILNAATPMEAVSNTITSSGPKVPDCFRNLIVSEWINRMTCDLPTPPGPLRNTRYGSMGLPCKFQC